MYYTYIFPDDAGEKARTFHQTCAQRNFGDRPTIERSWASGDPIWEVYAGEQYAADLPDGCTVIKSSTLARHTEKAINSFIDFLEDGDNEYIFLHYTDKWEQQTSAQIKKDYIEYLRECRSEELSGLGI